MADQFELPVEYKGHRYLFKTILLVFGFTHKFSVDVNGQMILFEPDEERNYRAVLDFKELDSNRNVDVELLRRIVEGIEILVK